MYRAVVMSALVSLGSGCTLLPPNAKAPATASATSSPTASPSQSPSASASAAAAAALTEAASPPFHGGEVAVGYKSVALTATGGVQPYIWALGAGALPNGLSLSSDGHVTGTPTRAGHFSFTVVVSDSGGGKASLNASATIVSALTVNFLRACGSTGKCSVEQGCVSVCGGFGYQGGGSAPYSYNVTGGSVPPGTYQYGLSLAGKFTTTGTFNFKATLTDGYGAAASLSPTFTVFPHISLGTGSPCYTSYYVTGCKTSVPYSSGGSGPKVRATSATGTLCVYSPTYSCGPTTKPPPGFSATAANYLVSVSVAPATGNNAFTFSGAVTLLLSDQSLCSSATNCSSTGSVTVNIQGG